MARLNVINLRLSAGRPIALIHPETARRLDLQPNDRIKISKPKKVYAIIDTFDLVKKNEIGLSTELSEFLNLKDGSKIDVSPAELSLATILIREKMNGKRLSEKEINFLISEITRNNLSEAEIAYFTAAEKLKGMNNKEIVSLVKGMVKTGSRLNFGKKVTVDKHCIGGVAGNRTTPIVVSICACENVFFPKTSSRAITSASGTADVIETIANVELSVEEIKEVVNKTNGCLVWGGSLGLAPSDDKIIRVERLLGLDIESQLIASILSKKISAGSKNLLIDIPYGKNLKVENLNQAKALARKFHAISKEFNLNLNAVCTKGERPIGRGVGPVLEMMDVLKVLKNDQNCPKDLMEKSILLSSEILKMVGVKNPKRKAKKTLLSGLAFEKFKEIINAQNKRNDFEKRVLKLKLGRYKRAVHAAKSGKIVNIDNRIINTTCRILGTPESPGSGMYLHADIGHVKKGDKLATLYSESKSKLNEALDFIQNSPPMIIR